MSLARSNEGIWFRFWLTSSRGTDEEGYRFFRFENFVLEEDGKIKEEDIRAELEQWCRNFGAWEHGDNYLKYGFEIKAPPRELVDKMIELSKKRIKWQRKHLGWLCSELSRLSAPDDSSGR